MRQPKTNCEMQAQVSRGSKEQSFLKLTICSIYRYLHSGRGSLHLRIHHDVLRLAIDHGLKYREYIGERSGSGHDIFLSRNRLIFFNSLRWLEVVHTSGGAYGLELSLLRLGGIRFSALAGAILGKTTAAQATAAQAAKILKLVRWSN